MIELLAYTHDRIIHGTVHLPGERLMDLLESTDPVTALDAHFLGLHFQADEPRPMAHIATGEFRLVVATGPRGDQDQRVPTRIQSVTADVGPYRVFGNLHLPEHGDAQHEIDSRTWFAITDAVLEYTRGFVPIRERHDAVLINRFHATRVMPVDTHQHEIRWLASRLPFDWASIGRVAATA